MFSGDKKMSTGDSPPIDTLIGENTTINGDLRFRGGLHVDGHIDGSVVAVDDQDGELILSEHGSIKGEINVPVVVINGCIEGDVVAGKRLELNSQARVSGNLRYRSILMQLGAEVNGQLSCERDDAGVAPVKRVADSPDSPQVGPLEPLSLASRDGKTKAGQK